MSSQFLAKGGYGCILSPALVLGKVVNETNKNLYVTKIARDAEDEFDIGRFVASKAPDSGVFPVDLICGISRANLPETVYRRITANCKDVLTSRNKRSVFGGKNAAKGKNGARGGKAFTEWCAVQYPKYLYDMYNFLKGNPPMCKNYPPMQLGRAANLIFERLVNLHDEGIYHMDIKGENMAVMSVSGGVLDIRFADWGSLTTVLPRTLFRYLQQPPPPRTPEDLHFALEDFWATEFQHFIPAEVDGRQYVRNGILARMGYYEQLMSPIFHNMFREVYNFMVDQLQRPNAYDQLHAMALLMTFIDVACTMTVVVNLIACRNRNPDLERFLSKRIDDYFNDTIEAFPRVNRDAFLSERDLQEYTRLFMGYSAVPVLPAIAVPLSVSSSPVRQPSRRSTRRRASSPSRLSQRSRPIALASPLPSNIARDIDSAIRSSGSRRRSLTPQYPTEL